MSKQAYEVTLRFGGTGERMGRKVPVIVASTKVPGNTKPFEGRGFSDDEAIKELELKVDDELAIQAARARLPVTQLIHF